MCFTLNFWKIVLKIPSVFFLLKLIITISDIFTLVIYILPALLYLLLFVELTNLYYNYLGFFFFFRYFVLIFKYFFLLEKEVYCVSCEAAAGMAITRPAPVYF